jgi:hypothetical protein
MTREKFPDEESPTKPEGELRSCPQCRGDGVLPPEQVDPAHVRAPMCPLCGGRCWVSKAVYTRWIRKAKRDGK